MYKKHIILISAIVLAVVVFGYTYVPHTVTNKVNIGITAADRNTVLKEPFTIGVITPLTGDAATIGEGVKNSIDLSVRDIQNRVKGESGDREKVPEFKVVYEDDQCDTKRAISAYQKLKNQNIHIFYVSCSGSVLALAPIAKQDGNLIVTAYAGSGEIRKTGDEVIRSIPDGLTVFEEIKKYLLGATKRGEKIAVLYEQQAYPESVAMKINEEVLSFDVTLFPYIASESSFRTQILKIKELGAEKIVLVPVSDKATKIMYTEMKSLGVRAHIVGDVNLCGYSFTPKDYGMTYTCFKAERKGTAADAFRKEYKSVYGIESQYSYYDIATYDLIQALHRILSGAAGEKSNQTIRSLKDALLSGYVTPTGVYEFTKDGEVVGAEYQTIQH